MTRGAYEEDAGQREAEGDITPRAAPNGSKTAVRIGHPNWYQQ